MTDAPFVLQIAIRHEPAGMHVLEYAGERRGWQDFETFEPVPGFTPERDEAAIVEILVALGAEVHVHNPPAFTLAPPGPALAVYRPPDAA